jgi:O-antigen/teichoic acid export membrane protein
MYLFRVIFARNVSLADFGLYYAISSILTLIITFVDFGLSDTYVKFFCEYKEKNDLPKLKGLIYSVGLTRALFGIILMVACYLSADFLMASFFKADGKLLFLLLCFGSIFTSITYNFLMATYRATQRMTGLSLMRVSSSAVMVMMLSGFLFWKSPIIAAIANISAPLIICIVFYFILRKDLKDIMHEKAEISFDHWKVIMSFGSSLILMAICNYLLNSTDVAMLTYFSSLDSVAIYNIALPVARIFLLFSTAINTPLLPHLSSLYAKEGMKPLKKRLLEVNGIALLLFLPAIFISFFMKYIILIFFGEQYISATIPAIILMFSVIFNILFNINLNALIVTNRLNAGNIIIVIGAVFNIILDYFMIKSWDIVGASIATLISYALITIIIAAYINRRLI